MWLLQKHFSTVPCHWLLSNFCVLPWSTFLSFMYLYSVTVVHGLCSECQASTTQLGKAVKIICSFYMDIWVSSEIDSWDSHLWTKIFIYRWRHLKISNWGALDLISEQSDIHQLGVHKHLRAINVPAIPSSATTSKTDFIPLPVTEILWFSIQYIRVNATKLRHRLKRLMFIVADAV